jgi:hypothetical protein
MFDFSFKVFESAEDKEAFDAAQRKDGTDRHRYPYFYGSAFGETRTEAVRKIASAAGVTHGSLLLDSISEQEPKESKGE